MKGIDTTFLIQLEVVGAPKHQRARSILESTLRDNGQLALAPQVLSEFIHIITDPRRFESPLSMSKAVRRAEDWWSAKEVTTVLPSKESVKLALQWLDFYKLGRKRILDTQLAATYYAAGIINILSSNERDFKVFELFDIESP